MNEKELKRHLMNPSFRSHATKTNLKHIVLHEHGQEDSDFRFFT